MTTFKLWLEMSVPPSAGDPWEAWEAWYTSIEPSIKPWALQQLASTGRLSIAEIGKKLGVSEGYASFVYRELAKRYRNADHEKMAARLDREGIQKEGKDDYLYHVTTKARLPLIRKNGLSPNAVKQFSNYSDYSSGKVFFAEKGGVKFWKQRVEEHEDHNSDRPSPVVVLKVKRSVLEDKLQNDGRGSEDSRWPSYYVTEKVPPKVIEKAE